MSLKKQTGQKVQKILANIFLEESLDQSNKELQNTRPMHLMSKLLITSNEINHYVNDYLKMVDEKSNNAYIEKMSSRLNRRPKDLNIDFPNIWVIANLNGKIRFKRSFNLSVLFPIQLIMATILFSNSILNAEGYTSSMKSFYDLQLNDINGDEIDLQSLKERRFCW
ncbi:MAG: hypothetical protein CM15mP44_2040 [Candidatus Neomarinimicrobiota bacterium]|nr:MAG: hypothetical protein CM15mP44_2040 [Candidatus Neomarinimicrobiota bacterium]